LTRALVQAVRALLAGAVALCLALHAAHAQPAQPPQPAHSTQAAEAAVRTPQRIVSLVPSLTETVCSLGACSRLVGTDRDLGRYTFVAGASIYPFAWNILLAARSEGLGGVMTTIHGRVEPQVKELLGVPDHVALATVMALGHPVHQPTKLRRDPVGSFATIDRFDGEPFAG